MNEMNQLENYFRTWAPRRPSAKIKAETFWRTAGRQYFLSGMGLARAGRGLPAVDAGRF